MNEQSLYSLLILFLEMTFSFVVLIILHNQRKRIGGVSFYLVLSGIFMFALFSAAADTRFSLGVWLEFPIGMTFLYMPCMAAVLLIYVNENTLTLQRLIIGEFILFGMLFYLAQITRHQEYWTELTWLPILSGGGFELLLYRMSRLLLAMALAHLCDLFVLPILFTFLRRMGGRGFFCVEASMVVSSLINTAILLSVWSLFEDIGMGFIAGTAIVRVVLAIYIGGLLAWYLYRIEKEARPEENRGSFDIVFSFISGYARSLSLERNLREWEGRYRQLVEKASEMILLLDNEGTVVEVNGAGAKILRSRTEKLIGESVYDLLVRPDGGKPDLAELEPAHRIQLLRHLPGGKVVNLDCSCSRINMQQRELYVIIGRDTTEEDRMEQEYRNLNEQITHLQRIESLGNLAGGVAHDFNNHLHAMLGNLDMLLMSPLVQQDEKIRKRLEKIIAIAEQSGKLTGQLLGFARKGKYNPVILNMELVVKEALGLFQVQGVGEITIHIAISAEEITVFGDKIQLEQALLNLMLNSAYAMKQSPKRELSIVLEKSGNEAVIKVGDTGCGMGEELQKNIFDPFFTTKPTGEGTGMGLSMVYGTVMNHHGKISVESEVGKGTVFTITLPITRE